MRIGYLKGFQNQSDNSGYLEKKEDIYKIIDEALLLASHIIAWFIIIIMSRKNKSKFTKLNEK